MLASNMEEDAFYMGGGRVPVVGSTQFHKLDADGNGCGIVRA